MSLRVFTVQGYDLRSFNGQIRIEQGTYGDRESIQTAQRNLYQRIGTDQVIWCSQDKPSYTAGKIGRYLHELNLDKRDIVAVINSLKWAQLIYEDPRYILPDDHIVLRHKAYSRESDDDDLAIREEEDRYLEAHRDESILRPAPGTITHVPTDQVLVKYPWSYSSVTAVSKIGKTAK